MNLETQRLIESHYCGYISDEKFLNIIESDVYDFDHDAINEYIEEIVSAETARKIKNAKDKLVKFANTTAGTALLTTAMFAQPAYHTVAAKYHDYMANKYANMGNSYNIKYNIKSPNINKMIKYHQKMANNHRNENFINYIRDK